MTYLSLWLITLGNTGLAFAMVIYEDHIRKKPFKNRIVLTLLSAWVTLIGIAYCILIVYGIVYYAAVMYCTM